MAIQGFCPPPPPYYQLLERGSARLGRVNKKQVKVIIARRLQFAKAALKSLISNIS